jgi:hypothetical protein
MEGIAFTFNNFANKENKNHTKCQALKAAIA